MVELPLAKAAAVPRFVESFEIGATDGVEELQVTD